MVDETLHIAEIVSRAIWTGYPVLLAGQDWVYTLLLFPDHSWLDRCSL
jgi:hypothetical protein